MDLVQLLGDACLDAETVTAFITFVHLQLDSIPNPEAILRAEDFVPVSEHIQHLVTGGETTRMDILSVMVTRLTNYLTLRKEEPNGMEFSNLVKFIMMDLMPNDLRLAMGQELASSKRPGLMKLYAVPEIGKLLLTKM